MAETISLNIFLFIRISLQIPRIQLFNAKRMHWVASIPARARFVWFEISFTKFTIFANKIKAADAMRSEFRMLFEWTTTRIECTWKCFALILKIKFNMNMNFGVGNKNVIFSHSTPITLKLFVNSFIHFILIVTFWSEFPILVNLSWCKMEKEQAQTSSCGFNVFHFPISDLNLRQLNAINAVCSSRRVWPTYLASLKMIKVEN